MKESLAITTGITQYDWLQPRLPCIEELELLRSFLDTVCEVIYVLLAACALPAIGKLAETPHRKAKQHPTLPGVAGKSSFFPVRIMRRQSKSRRLTRCAQYSAPQI